MIYLTGDTHQDFSRFEPSRFTPSRHMTKDDFVIVCGDFGVWDGGWAEQMAMARLNMMPFTTLFVTGNHSNYDRLSQLPVTSWHGGQVQYLDSSLIHLMRGQVYDIDGHSFFTMGGASSHDVPDGILDPDDPDFTAKKKALDARFALYRVAHRSWWRQELPDDAEYATARASLERVGWKVDYVVTHCIGSRVQDLIAPDGGYEHDRLTDFFDEISGRLDFRWWFFGHYHDDRVVMNRYMLLYRQIIRLPD